MAITPRTIFASAAPATLAIASLGFFTVLGTSAYQSLQSTRMQDPWGLTVGSTLGDPRLDQCAHLPAALGEPDERWGERAWIEYIECFRASGQGAMVIAMAQEGLRFHPGSTYMYVAASEEQRRQGDYDRALQTLQTGLGNVSDAKGQAVIANNLAWVGLSAPRAMRLEQARAAYSASLTSAPGVCETLHTGMWVEYAIAQDATGVDRFDALSRFSVLADEYTPCMTRQHQDPWFLTTEALGAAMLLEDVTPRQTVEDQALHPAMVQVAQSVQSHYRGTSLDALCKEAIPMAHLHHRCVDQLSRALEQATDLPAPAQNLLGR